VIEYFDVVDEHDVVTGEKTTKVEAHAAHTIHRCIAVYVFDTDGNLYVQDHKSSGLLDHSVGGHVGAGEDYLTAALREAEEEIDLKDQTLTLVYQGLPSDEVFYPSKQTSRSYHMFGIFEAIPDAAWLFKPNEEVERITAVPLTEVVRGMQENPGRYTPGFINTMAKFLEIKRPDIVFDVESCRKNWSEL
jgi:isopentenyldiphosphate isomerase